MIYAYKSFETPFKDIFDLKSGAFSGKLGILCVMWSFWVKSVDHR